METVIFMIYSLSLETCETILKALEDCARMFPHTYGLKRLYSYNNKNRTNRAMIVCECSSDIVQFVITIGCLKAGRRIGQFVYDDKVSENGIEIYPCSEK